MTYSFKRVNVVMFMALAVVLYLVYSPGLDGPFVFDDMHNIVHNPNIKIDELSATQLYNAGVSPRTGARISRPISRVSLALNYFFSGKQLLSFSFKATNLIIHIINTLLVFVLTRRLLHCLRARYDDRGPPQLQSSLWLWFPLVVAALWALHPIQLTGVLYVVQRMTSLGAMCVLAGLLVFVLGRCRLQEERSFGLALMVLGIVIGGLLGSLCKENAILTPAYALVIELVFFDRVKLSPAARLRLNMFFGVTLGLLGIAAMLLFILKPEFVTRLYNARNFTMDERLLTQARVLFFYIGLTLLPSLRSFSLYHDYIMVSKGLLSPWTTLLSLVAWGALIFVALRCLKRAPMLSFAVLWFVVGHAVESSVLGLEIAFEHRNYLPSFGVLLALTYYGFRFIELRSLAKPVAALAVCLVLGTVSFVTHARAGAWSSLDSLAYFTVRNHPTSYRAQLERAHFLERHHHDAREVYRSYRSAAAVNPYVVPPLAHMYRVVNKALSTRSEKAVAQSQADHGILAVKLFESELESDRRILEELDKQIADEISHRILSYSLSSSTIQALDDLRVCVVKQPGACGPVERVERWLAMALDRTQVEQQRTGLLLVSARFYAWTNRKTKGAELLRSALESYPDSVGLLLELAYLNLSMNNFDEVESLLGRALAVTGKNGRRSADIQALQTLLRRRTHNRSDDEPGIL